MATTSIRVNTATRRKLARLKKASGGTYDEMLTKLLTLVPEGDEEGRYTDEFRWSLVEARQAIREGRVVDDATLKKRLGL